MDMDRRQRMELLKFVCSFAWTDLTVQQRERDLIMRIAGRFDLAPDDVRQVERWLAVPPEADDVDPTAIPRAHRETFLRAAEAIVQADGQVAPVERDQLAVFRDLLRDS